MLNIHVGLTQHVFYATNTIPTTAAVAEAACLFRYVLIRKNMGIQRELFLCQLDAGITV